LYIYKNIINHEWCFVNGIYRSFNGNYIKALFRLRNLTFQAMGDVRYTQVIGFEYQEEEIQSGD